MNTREQHAGERDHEADRREQLVDLYRGAVTSSVAGAVEVSRWVRADAHAHAHLQRRHELLARDGSALDRYDDAERRDQQHAVREVRCPVSRTPYGNAALPHPSRSLSVGAVPA